MRSKATTYSSEQKSSDSQAFLHKLGGPVVRPKFNEKRCLMKDSVLKTYRVNYLLAN
jgi:hypothetical protein